ncbi:hypothetical protein WR25_04926 isoform A [Diploscapter pachys]|uniref:RING-type E3 ubiquitin transferase n=1 Tax=Diploscapter pachys TaxID=2018661 RepID=A0A2A2JQB8_9BILA|nr:hypothetical protein WR25_04926 isoform A [Diploscapter pachys]
MEIEDDEIRLPDDTLEILKQFQEEQLKRAELEQSGEAEISEDWQLSQFWYDEATTTALAREVGIAARNRFETDRENAESNSGTCGSENCGPTEMGPLMVACVASPTLMNGILELEEFKSNQLDVRLFEFDERFRIKYPDQFIHYDYNQPQLIPKELMGKFDLIIADPPFLSDERVVKGAQTIRLLGKQQVKIIFCTGAIMEQIGNQRSQIKSLHAADSANTQISFCSTVCVLELVQDAFRRFDLNTVYSPFVQPTTCVNRSNRNPGNRAPIRMAPSGQATSWADVLCCVRCNQLFSRKRLPVNLACSHVICKNCVADWQPKKCPIDETEPTLDPQKYSVNSALLHIIDNDYSEDELIKADIGNAEEKTLSQIESDLRYLSGYLHQTESERGGSVYSEQLSRPLQLKLVSLLCYQLLEEDGRSKALKTCRTMAERITSEVLNTHQSSSHVSTHLWTAVRARGCQFLGPAMQEDVLKLILLTLEKGALIARKTLVMYVVSMLSEDYPQVSKTCVGHVVQLLYRASCFNVIKRDGESSLMQLKEEFRNYEALRKEHDAQIVQMALEAGLRITPDQWSALLYGDQDHRSHMQSIIDKLQSPNSYSQGLEELTVMAESNPTVNEMLPFLDLFQSVNPSQLESVAWDRFAECLSALKSLIDLQVKILSRRNEARVRENTNEGMKRNGFRKLDGPAQNRYKTKICREVSLGQHCPRGDRCTYAHSVGELRYDPQQMQQPQMGGPLGYTIMPPYRKAIPHQPLMGTPRDPRMAQPRGHMPMMMQMPPPPQHQMMGPPPQGPPQVPTNPAVAYAMNGGSEMSTSPMQQPSNTTLITAGTTPIPNVLPPVQPMVLAPNQPPTASSIVGQPPNQVIMHSPPTQMAPPPGAMVMMPPPPTPMGTIVTPQGIWSAPQPPPGTAQGPPLIATPGPAQYWVQAPRSYNPLVDGPMTNADWQQLKQQEKVEADTEQLLLKRSEIINRLAPLAIADDEEDDGVGHVSYTGESFVESPQNQVASSVLEDRFDYHHPIMLMAGPVPTQPIELPAIPATFATSVSLPPAPTEETMNLIGENIAAMSSAGNRPRTGSNPTTSTNLMNVETVTSATVQSDCSSMTVKDVLSQPLPTPVIQMTAAHVVTLPVMMMPTMAGAPIGTPMDCATVTYSSRFQKKNNMFQKKTLRYLLNSYLQLVCFIRFEILDHCFKISLFSM